MRRLLSRAPAPLRIGSTRAGAPDAWLRRTRPRPRRRAHLRIACASPHFRPGDTPRGHGRAARRLRHPPNRMRIAAYGWQRGATSAAGPFIVVMRTAASVSRSGRRLGISRLWRRCDQTNGTQHGREPVQPNGMKEPALQARDASLVETDMKAEFTLGHPSSLPAAANEQAQRDLDRIWFRWRGAMAHGASVARRAYRRRR